MTMTITCCGGAMLWVGFTRDRDRPADVYRCGYCGRVQLVAAPAVSPRYLRVSRCS